MEPSNQYLIVNEKGEEVFSINWFNSAKKEEIYPKIEKYIYNKIIYLLLLIKEASNENLNIDILIDKKDFIEENINLLHPLVLDKINDSNKVEKKIIDEIYEDFKKFRNWKKISKLADFALIEMGISNLNSENFDSEMEDDFLF